MSRGQRLGVLLCLPLVAGALLLCAIWLLLFHPSDDREESSMFSRVWARLRARLIDDWRRAWRFWSVRLSVLSAVLMGGWQALPPELRADLPYANQVAVGLFLLVALSRLAQQGTKAP